MRYLFEEYAFDTGRRELYREANIVSVAPQVFDLLDYLIRNRERVVSKDELINAVWNGRIVSDAALTTRLNVARSAIGDSGEEQRLIKTLPRKGFRFVGNVQEAQRPAIAVGSAPSPVSVPHLSIVVLPFANIGDDPEQAHLVDGVTGSLTTDLSRISGSFVIGRHTAFTYNGKAVDVKQIGRELNVRYVLEGSVQRSGTRLRINVQLIDSETGNNLWAERFDKPIADLFDMQDEIVSRLANTLNAQLIVVEARRAERTPHPDVMDLYFQGTAWWHKGTTPECMMLARGFFEHALALDPENIEALVGMAIVDAMSVPSVTADDRTSRIATAEAAVIKALSLAPQHPLAHAVFGFIQILTNRATQGIDECARALSLDQNLAIAHGWIGLAKVYVGRSEETEAHIHEALRLSPRDIHVFRWMMFVGIAKAQLRSDDEAIAWLRRGIEANRNQPMLHFHLAAALARRGAQAEARVAAEAGLALNPGFTVRKYRATVSSDNPTYLAFRDRNYEGMRMAGIPEG